MVGTAVRQVSPADARLNVTALAKTCAQLIIGHESHPWITWHKDGTAKVNVGLIVPTTNKETTISRRKRFRAALINELEPAGWEEVTAGVWTGSEQA